MSSARLSADTPEWALKAIDPPTSRPALRFAADKADVGAIAGGVIGGLVVIIIIVVIIIFIVRYRRQKANDPETCK